MKNLIWINPVVKNMCNELELNDMLKKIGFKVVECNLNHINNVKLKYKNEINPNFPILDARCPKAVNFIEQNFSYLRNFISKTQPILIHSAIELSANLNKNEKLFITTPCEDLAIQGNNLQLKNTIFLTWKDFKKQFNINISENKLLKSPIPSGFFDSLGVKSVFLTTKDNIENTLKYKFKDIKDVDIVEILYCENGCHNGEGI